MFTDGEYEKNSGSHVTSTDNWIDLKSERMWSVETRLKYPLWLELYRF